MSKLIKQWVPILMLFGFLLGLRNCDLTRGNVSSIEMPPLGFGSYVIMMRSLSSCISLPKTIDAESFGSHSFEGKMVNYTEQIIFGKLHAPKTVKLVKAKFTPLYVKRDGSYITSLNRSTFEPCTDMIMSVPVKLFFPVDKTCVVKKGNYTFTLNLNRWIHDIVGNTWPYSRAQIQFEYFSEIGMVLCVYGVIDFIPIPKLPRKKKKIYRNKHV